MRVRLQPSLPPQGSSCPGYYLSLLRLSNGGGGPLGVEPGWFQLWPAEEILSLNLDYEVGKYVPGLLGFGSNGGGELLAFDTWRGPPWKIVMIPCVGVGEGDIVEVAEDFAEFLQATGRGRCE